MQPLQAPAGAAIAEVRAPVHASKPPSPSSPWPYNSDSDADLPPNTRAPVHSEHRLSSTGQGSVVLRACFCSQRTLLSALMAETDRPLTTARDVARVEEQIRDLTVLRRCMLQALDKQNTSMQTIGTCASFAAGEASSASGSSTSAGSDSSGSSDEDFRKVHAAGVLPSRLLLGDASRTLGDIPAADEPACAGALALTHGCDASYMKELDNPDLWPASRFDHVQLLAGAL